MKGFYVRLISLLAALLAAGGAFGAEPVTFKANAPMIVPMGEAFRVEFSLDAMPDDNTFEAPSFEGFDVLAGPTVSRGQSVQIVNGSMTKRVEYTITYVLLPRQAGNATVGAASIQVDKRSYSTRALPIEVVDEGAAGGKGQPAVSGSSGAQGGSAAGTDAQTAAQGQVGRDDILLRLSVSRQVVFKGEPLRATFKLYRRVPIVGYENIKFPSFNGFWAQELNVGNAAWQRETLGGKVYESVVVREYLLYPQQAGTLTVEPADITAIAQVVVQSSRNVDPFFGGGHEVYDVRRRVQTPRVSITVKELPAGAPSSFSGAVGRFTMEATPPQGPLGANSSGTFTVRISGTGNLPFVQAPKLTLPASFEQYDVKTTESIKTTAAGTSGYRQFEYPFIPRAEGSYRIEPVEFTYFDPGQMRYVTLASGETTLEVTPDANGPNESYVVKGLTKEDVRMLGQDIRFIKLGRAQLRTVAGPFLFSGAYFILLGGILVLFVLIYAALRKQIRDSQNMALVRGRRANKVAVERFRTARRYMTEQNRQAFYEEMLRALWGYMSDKFNIPVANLTKENVREELLRRGVATEEAQRFSSIITRCEEAQYSPVDSARMSDIYREGLVLVSSVESVIKR